MPSHNEPLAFIDDHIAQVEEGIVQSMDDIEHMLAGSQRIDDNREGCSEIIHVVDEYIFGVQLEHYNRIHASLVTAKKQLMGYREDLIETEARNA